MATRVRNYYKPDRAGVVGILTSQPVAAALSRLALDGKKIAEGIAPVETGRYKSSFEVRLGTRGSGNRRRAVARLSNTDPKSIDIEWGNPRGRKPQRVLGRTQSLMRARGLVS